MDANALETPSLFTPGKRRKTSNHCIESASLGSCQGYNSDDATMSSRSGQVKRAESCLEMWANVDICRSISSYETCSLKFRGKAETGESGKSWVIVISASESSIDV